MAAKFTSSHPDNKPGNHGELDFEFLGTDDQNTTYKQMFSQMIMGIESKDFIFGFIPQRIFVSMESYGTIAK